jgi:hypothetical protein
LFPIQCQPGGWSNSLPQFAIPGDRQFGSTDSRKEGLHTNRVAGLQKSLLDRILDRILQILRQPALSQPGIKTIEERCQVRRPAYEELSLPHRDVRPSVRGADAEAQEYAETAIHPVSCDGAGEVRS